MKVFTRDYRIPHFKSSAFSRYFGGSRPCVFDIEATGLDPQRCKLVMTAMLVETPEGVRITQFLAENHYEEERVLAATMEFLKDEGIDFIITYNGARYDVPFVNTRLEKLIMPYNLNLYDLDLYRFIKKETILPKLMKSLSQGMVEEFFGFRNDRKDTITGRESVALFDKYALTGDSITEKIILTHNREDVLQLYKILCALSADGWMAKLKRSCFDEAISDYGMPVADKDGNIVMTASCRINGAVLEITGSQLVDPISAAKFRDADRDFDADFRSTTRTYAINVYLNEYEGNLFVNPERLELDSEEITAITASENYVNGFLIVRERNEHGELCSHLGDINALARALCLQVR